MRVVRCMGKVTIPHRLSAEPPLHKGAFNSTLIEFLLAPEGSIGRGRKGVKKNAALLHFLAFAFSDHIFGVLRGEQPLSRGLRVAHERARFAGWRRSLCAAKRLPRNSETFFASFFGHKKGRSPGRSLLAKGPAAG